MKKLFFGFLLTGLFAICAQATITLQLNPGSGALSATPGSTVGWGFTLTNTSGSEWLLTTGSEFLPASLYGSYQDYIGLSGVVVGPSPESSAVTQSFDAIAQTGVGAFTIDSTAPIGTLIQGHVVIDYSLFSQDPNDPAFNPDNSTVVADATISAPAALRTTPEPASFLLILSGALPLFASMLPGKRLRASRGRLSS